MANEMPEWIKLTYIYKLKYRATLNKLHFNIENGKVISHHYVFLQSPSGYPSLQEHINKLRNK